MTGILIAAPAPRHRRRSAAAWLRLGVAEITGHRHYRLGLYVLALTIAGVTAGTLRRWFWLQRDQHLLP